MHIILARQPAPAQKPAGPRLTQLRPRVSIVQGPAPLSHGEVKNYVDTACALPDIGAAQFSPTRPMSPLRPPLKASPKTSTIDASMPSRWPARYGKTLLTPTSSTRCWPTLIFRS